ncbi:MAG: aspartyl protease family protein [Candidatus Rokubacteria bacterium]|nr:aspartyl protease family protein [Candidatus Rokubacteria bacterium]
MRARGLVPVATALLGNRLDEARRWLGRAVEIEPGEKEPAALLAEVHYRCGEFRQAASLFRAAGAEAVAENLESFKTSVPYAIEGEARATRVKFIHTDPLPLVAVRVNGGEEVNFIIDTGAAEVCIDTEFTGQVGAARSGSVSGTFGGGQRAAVEQGRIDSLTLGDSVVRNLPVQILNTRRFDVAARGRRVDGILGTRLFYRFLTTLDYPAGELVLRRKAAGSLKRFERQARTEKQVVVPF